jgi:hypothetical protein
MLRKLWTYQNPYGIAFVPHGFPSGGPLSPGDILVSNFNNAGASPTGNIQGTGTTITRVAPDGETSTFFTGVFKSPTDGGLTTALGVLKGSANCLTTMGRRNRDRSYFLIKAELLYSNIQM